MKTTLAAVVDSTREFARNIGANHADDDAPDATHDPSNDSTDALAIIKADHQRVAALFERVLADGTSVPKMRPLVAEIVRELETHAKMEETIFYPALRKQTKTDGEDRQRVLEAVEEHGTLKDLIKKIKKSTGRDETLRAKLQVLKELVEHHVGEEEREMFGEAERLLGEARLAKLGREMAAFKRRGTRRASSARKAARATEPTREKSRNDANRPAKRTSSKKR